MSKIAAHRAVLEVTITEGDDRVLKSSIKRVDQKDRVEYSRYNATREPDCLKYIEVRSIATVSGK
jgi:hypothetical protein